MHSVIIACTIATLITTYIYIASSKVQFNLNNCIVQLAIVGDILTVTLHTLRSTGIKSVLFGGHNVRGMKSDVWAALDQGIINNSFIPAISIAPLQVLYYLEALPTTARILHRSFTPKRTGNCR